jgi:glutamyl-tRNA synthetase
VYIRGLGDNELAARLRPLLPAALTDEVLAGLVPLVKERMVRLTDAVELSGFLSEPDGVVASWWSVEDLLPKGRGGTEVAAALGAARAALAASDQWDAERLEAVGRGAAEAHGWKAGDFFKPIRVAVTGRAISPPLFGSMVLLGRERSLARLDEALERLGVGAAG